MVQVKPIFRVFDRQKAIEFYVDWLGFIVDWEHKFDDNAPLYMQVSFNGIVLHLSEHHGDCSPGARIHIENFHGLEAYHKTLTERKYKYNKPGLETAFYDSSTITVEVIDPFGNRITFTGAR